MDYKILDSGAEGCKSTGGFRRVNCSNEIWMLRSVLNEVEVTLRRSREQSKNISEVAEIVAEGLMSIALQEDDIYAIHEADQIRGLSAEAESDSQTHCAVACPGGKLFSTLCQAKLVRVDAIGNVTAL